MARGEGRYVGPRAPVWPLDRPLPRLGCSAAVWLCLVIGLGLAVFSLGGIASDEAFLVDHTPVIWVAVAALSLAWPGLYLWAGWYRTLLGYWPAPGEGEGIGPPCETCGSTVRKGHTHYGHYVCDVCARQRAVDNRRIIVPLVVTVGVAFVGNGVGSLVEVRAMRSEATSPGGLLALVPTYAQQRWSDTVGLMGAVGGLGLLLVGDLILVRVVRRMVLAPIRGRAILSVRAQIGAALDLEPPASATPPAPR